MNDKMINGSEIKLIVAKRLANARMRIIFSSPFYGNLLLHMKFALGNCGSAATDMKQIIFDPGFVLGISDEELDFVILHEILHCVLQHCLRRNGRDRRMFNVACDIVVNSHILQGKGKLFAVSGEIPMHLTPEGKEGYLYSAEEVYDLLKAKYEESGRGVDKIREEISDDYGEGIDDHEVWDVLPKDGILSDEWKKNLIDAAKVAGEADDLPPLARKLLEEYKAELKLNWKSILRDFISEIIDRYDFSFVPPDRRFLSEDVILPAFSPVIGEQVQNLWFLIDTSGSISCEQLSHAFEEVKGAISQFSRLTGKVSFFDTSVSDPRDFDSIDTFEDIEPVGGGGTSFEVIFDYLKGHMKRDLPAAIIIFTDGYAVFPDEGAALGVPVLWIYSQNDDNAPWGITIHM